MQVAVVIPSYKVTNHILDVIKKIELDVHVIYVVDDCCPDQSGEYVLRNCHDTRVKVLFNKQNLGVGGAVITGFQQALKDNVDIVIKIDGDGQMNPEYIPRFIKPIILGQADYCKGNRFYSLNTLMQMPPLRRFGNTMLSFISKVSSGYWNIMDPTNGYFAIHKITLSQIPLDKINNGFFFESDMLFRLYLARAVVKDIPMNAVYADETSNLSIIRTVREFPILYATNFIKRFLYSYLIRDFTAASIETIVGGSMVLWGILFGSYHWVLSLSQEKYASGGTIMLASLPLILGFQMLLHAMSYDIQNIPSVPLQKDLVIEKLHVN